MWIQSYWNVSVIRITLFKVPTNLHYFVITERENTNKVGSEINHRVFCFDSYCLFDQRPNTEEQCSKVSSTLQQLTFLDSAYDNENTVVYSGHDRWSVCASVSVCLSGCLSVCVAHRYSTSISVHICVCGFVLAVNGRPCQN